MRCFLDTEKPFFLVLMAVSCLGTQLLAQDNGPTPKYLPRTVIFKMKPDAREMYKRNKITHPSVQALFNRLEVKRLEKKFPGHIPNTGGSKRFSPQQIIDLSLIYEMEYSAHASVEKVIAALKATGLVEYAQPHFLVKPLYLPNDPKADTAFGQQYYLQKINGYMAWDITKGDTSVVIGIVDDGSNLFHEDLIDNIAYNIADTIDGIDNDNDGFIDNYRGWDLADNDNDPTGLTDPFWGTMHGAMVSGIAAATTDNGKGIAGVGFRCRFLPVKIFSNTSYLTPSYEGIVYAADHGCKVINCSWKSEGAGPFEQDVIDYATIVKDALVIAAAGNDNNKKRVFPAALQHVISVCGGDANDVKTSSSTYGFTIDLMSPGVLMHTTNAGTGGYFTTGAATSFAAPVASGAAALMRAHFPQYSALQTGEQLRVTADVVDTLPANLAYAGKLGSGRINLYRALTETAYPSIRMKDITITDGNDNLFMPGDTLAFTTTFVNYLAPAGNAVVTLNSNSPDVAIIDSTFTLGPLATMAALSNTASPFIITALSSIPYNEMLELKFKYSDGSWSSYEYAEVEMRPDYLNFSVNDISTTITSTGKVGYKMAGEKGNGLVFSGKQLLFEAGLMFGVSPTRVSDDVRTSPFALDGDFVRVIAVSRSAFPALADIEFSGSFSDDSAGIGAMNVIIEQRALGWMSGASDSNFIILEYRIVNRGTSALSSVYAGFFTDWDILNPFMNRAAYEPAYKMGYVYSTEWGSPYAGIALLSEGQITHYAIDADGSAGSVNVNEDGNFSDAEKYITLTQNRNSAGTSGGGNDVMHTVSGGPFSIMANDTLSVAFALIAASTLPDLLGAAFNAHEKYESSYKAPIDTTGMSDTDKNHFGLVIYPIPATGRLFAEITPSARGEAGFAELEFYDICGKSIMKYLWHCNGASDCYHVIDVSSYRHGMYFYTLRINTSVYRGKVVLL